MPINDAVMGFIKQNRIRNGNLDGSWYVIIVFFCYLKHIEEVHEKYP